MAKKSFIRKDRFYFKAKKEGYPARSAYKIIELNKRFGIFKPGRKIVDLGCAPGGWLMVAEEILAGKGTLVGIDLLPLHYTPLATTHFIQGDFTAPAERVKIKTLLKGQADWVLSDMSPDISGIAFRDTFQSTELAGSALEFVLEILKPQGGFLFKVFPGPELEDFRKQLARHFKKVRTVIPEATRQSSTEIYIVCQEIKAA